MGLNTFSSDYGSGSSMNSSTSWGSQELDWQTFQSQLLNPERPRKKAASFADLANGRCTIEEVMQEFHMNGSDSPYYPDDDQYWTRTTAADMSPNMTAASAYMRQRSWPAPERSPAPRPPRPSPRLPRPVSASYSYPVTATHAQPAIRPTNEVLGVPSAPAPPVDALTSEQRRVLCSLPDATVLTLLREMQRRNKRQPDECRFCKNNGERESYYRSHVLKDSSGCVACPVLRAFVCKRCGASGDTAHTIKYCPLSTSEERIKSAAMMRSVRLSSGRRRTLLLPDDATLPGGGGALLPGALLPGATLPGALLPGGGAPLDPQWAQLEQKLML